MKLTHNLIRTVILLLGLSATTNAFAWKWSDVLWEIGKGVIIEVIVDNIKPGAYAKENQPPSQYPTSRIENSLPDEYSNIKTLAVSHFQADSQCNLGHVMSFYDDVVYYEGKDISKNQVKKKKASICEKYSESAYYSIKNNEITISPFSKDSNVTLIDYYINFEVYSKKKQKILRGIYKIRLVIRDNKIIGQFHKDLKVF